MRVLGGIFKHCQTCACSLYFSTLPTQLLSWSNIALHLIKSPPLLGWVTGSCWHFTHVALPCLSPLGALEGNVGRKTLKFVWIAGGITETESGTKGRKSCRWAEALEFCFFNKITTSRVTLLHALTCPSLHAVRSSDSSSSSSDESPARSVQSTAVPAPASQLLPSLEKDEPRKSFGIKVQNLPVRSTDTSLKDGLFHEFKKYGKVTSVQIHGASEERYGLVFFRQQEDQEKALNASKGKLFFGMQIEVTAWIGPGKVHALLPRDCSGDNSRALVKRQNRSRKHTLKKLGKMPQ